MAPDVIKLVPVPKASKLPFYCHPIKLFLFIWMLMLASLNFHITYESYPDMGIPLTLFVLSFSSLMAGYTFTRLIFFNFAPPRIEPEFCAVNITRLRKLNLIFALIAIAIMLLNLKLDGLPPALGFFSFDTVLYQEYGRLKQILFPLLIALFVNAFLDPSLWRKLLFSFFSIASLFLYVTRGEILMALLQGIIVFSMMSTTSKRKIYGIVIGILTLAGVGINALGNARTPAAVFLAYLQIRQKFWDWPMPYLWAISYFSIPISNMCWIVRVFDLQHISPTFLYPILPAFWTPDNPFGNLLGGSHIIDGVHTYLSSYYLDAGFWGIIAVNLALGIVSAYIVRRGLNRFYLTTAIFVGCIGYIFFVDNFLPLSTILQVGMQAVVQKRVLSWTFPESDGREREALNVAVPLHEL